MLNSYNLPRYIKIKNGTLQIKRRLSQKREAASFIFIGFAVEANRIKVDVTTLSGDTGYYFYINSIFHLPFRII
jgi:hypothetical protein